MAAGVSHRSFSVGMADDAALIGPTNASSERDADLHATDLSHIELRGFLDEEAWQLVTPSCPGLVPGIHVVLSMPDDVDGRVKPGHDGERVGLTRYGRRRTARRAAWPEA
ncbi:hypothetical protein SSBR45G_38990 [Bradyrhizobium sp. SSBR45G]|nr:hypothetical protein SSBR45G_38990 [Bradyrhizobium sp. SSBR45G]GLH85313.1 hypothetical protein SSBR45R_27730 [Bradyrhizobium sp. SSBR45R]